MATRKGLVKKTDLMDYSRVRQGGIIGITLDEGDELIDVCLTRPGDEVVLSTNATAWRSASARRTPARWAARTRREGDQARQDDEVVGMVVADPDGLLLSSARTATASGLRSARIVPMRAKQARIRTTQAQMKRRAASVAEAAPSDNGDEASDETDPTGMRYRLQRRGGKGLKDVKVTAKNGHVVGIASVRVGDEIMLITKDGMVTRSKVDDIRIVGRNTQGVRVMNLNEGDKLVTVAKVASEAVAEADEKPAE